MSRIATISALALGGAVVAGCELDVTNTNNPDRSRVISSPSAVEEVISSAFSGWWDEVHSSEPAWALSTMADEFSGGFLDFGLHHSSQEPRQAWNNSPTFTYNDTNEDPWYGLHEVVSNVNDALAAMNRGVVPTEAARARAVGKFMQGLAHAYLGLYFDSAYVYDETVVLDTLDEFVLQPYQVLVDSGLSQMTQAIDAAGTGPSTAFTIPAPPGWFRTTLTRDQLVRLARSFMARIMISKARTRAERDAVDWDSVLVLAEQGIQTDFAPIAEPDIFDNLFLFRCARQRTTTPSDFARPDNWLLGPADTTNAFIAWVNTPVANRQRFRLGTNDRRIQGATSDTGLYFGYHNAPVWNPTRGTYHQSNYAYFRMGRGTGWENGPQLAMTVTEMNLIRAEALIRLGRAADAVPLINLTREANGELPPVDISGPPDVPGCVPRKYWPINGPSQGACGSLWDALRYEKRIEMAGVDPGVAYSDARGWQTLVENTYIHFPVPGRELGTTLRPQYTYGGGGPGSAPAPDPHRCPPGAGALPRCP